MFNLLVFVKNALLAKICENNTISITIYMILTNSTIPKQFLNYLIPMNYILKSTFLRHFLV